MGLFTHLFVPSKDRFAEYVRRALAKQSPTVEWSYDSGEFALKGPHKTTFFLANIYDEYGQARIGARQALFEKYLASCVAKDRPLPETWSDAKDHILPVLRSRWTYERLKLTHPEGAAQALHLVSDRLVLDLAFDTEDAIRGIGAEQLAVWGLNADEARAVAEDNLRRRSTEPLKQPVPGVGFYASTWADNYDATRMILQDFLHRHEVYGDPVVMVPHRDLLLLAGDRDADALAAMARAAQTQQDEPRALCFEAYRRVDDTWQPFAVETAHPALSSFRDLRMEELARYYADQKNLMDAANTNNGVDLFVASHKLASKDGSDEVFSFATWTRGADSLLPEADRVILFDGEARHLIVPWDAVREHCAELMEVVDVWPRRFRVRSFPSEEKIETLAQLTADSRQLPGDRASGLPATASLRGE